MLNLNAIYNLSTKIDFKKEREIEKVPSELNKKY